MVIVEAAGPDSRNGGGRRQTVQYEQNARGKREHDALQKTVEAVDIVLYKTSDHWEWVDRNLTLGLMAVHNFL